MDIVQVPASLFYSDLAELTNVRCPFEYYLIHCIPFSYLTFTTFKIILCTLMYTNQIPRSDDCFQTLMSVRAIPASRAPVMTRSMGMNVSVNLAGLVPTAI